MLDRQSKLGFELAMDAINHTTDEDEAIIKRIANRAWDEECVREVYDGDKLSLVIDLTFCNYSNPLRLQEMLESSDFNFLHDVLGIAKHLNRDTGLLTDCFSPRFTK